MNVAINRMQDDDAGYSAVESRKAIVKLVDKACPAR